MGAGLSGTWAFASMSVIVHGIPVTRANETRMSVHGLQHCSLRPK